MTHPDSPYPRPLTSTLGCAIHRTHRTPIPLYTELHHVIPRAWQGAWHPPGAVNGLWARETVALCRTGHGNVHWILTAAMHRYGGDVDRALHDAMRELHCSLRMAEARLARDAMVKFRDAGGDLAGLVGAGLYGEI